MESSTVSPALRLDTLPKTWPEITVGWAALTWATEYLVQPNGPRARELWMPTDRQARFIAWWYAVDQDGTWLFHHGARRLAKGSGKSPFAAVLALIELCGPCRVADIDLRLPVIERVQAKPVDLPLVEIAAASESQTANTMRMVRAMAPKGSRVAREHGLDPGKMIYYKQSGGELRVITSSAVTAEGSESSFVVADETEHWYPSNGGTALAETLDRNLAKSGSRMIETSNAWEPGRESVAESTHAAWLAGEEGRTRGGSRILYDAVLAPPDVDLTDRGSLDAALANVYEDCPWVDRGVIRERIWDPRTPPDVSRRFYLNQPTATVSSWTTPQAWAACADPTVVVPDRSEIALFFDGSLTGDATALIGCEIATGHVFTVGVWEPQGEDQVPTGEVDAAVQRAFDRWDVRVFFADVHPWEGFVKVTWPQRWRDQVEVWASPESRTDPQPIAWDMRAKVREFTLACELTLAEIDGREFTHDGDSRVARHVGNARRRPNRFGVSIGKESKDSMRKIDAGVSVIGARLARRALLAHRAKHGTKRAPRVGRVFGF